MYGPYTAREDPSAVPKDDSDNDPRPPFHLCRLDHIDHWYSDEGYYYRADSLEGAYDVFIVLEGCEEHGYQQYYKEWGKATGDCCNNAAFCAS